MIGEPRLTAQERRRIAAGVTESGEFALAGTHFRISASSVAPLAAFRARYGGLEVKPGSGSPPREIFCHQAEAPEPQLTLLANGRAFRLRGDGDVESAATTLLHLMTLAVRSHYLLHAGCVAIDGRGIVLAGGSGIGKSTLCAHLAVRGAELLSDEIAPLARESGLIEPAPLAVGLRPGAGDGLAAGRDAEEISCRGDRKKLVSVASLSGGAPGRPVRPAAVVILTRRAAASVETVARHRGPVRIRFSRGDEGLAALAESCRLRVLSQGREAGLPFIVCEPIDASRDPEHGVAALLRLAAERGNGLAGVRFDDGRRPDFAASPELCPIPAAAGILEVVKRISPLQLKELLRDEFGGRIVPLVRELAGLLRGASFFKLTPGRLEEMLSLVEDLR
jgi:hypothetical protein